MTVLDAAGYYVDLGLHPIPIPLRQKAPAIKDWPALLLTKADLPRYFNCEPSNIGVVLGDDYGTADIDLDCNEAIATARDLLPETAMIFGRQSKPASHYFYRADPPIRSKRYLDPVDKQCLIELRCQKSDGTIGLQTVTPPSVHPEGEPIRFEPGCDRDPANVDASTLQMAVVNVAAASLLARHWPGEKSGRNQAFIALAGALARGGWPVDRAVGFHGAIYHALWGPRADMDAARAEVLATYEKHGGGFETTGKRSLAGLVDRRAVHAALSWLGISLPSAPANVLQQGQPTRLATPSESRGIEDLMDDTRIMVPELAIEDLLPKEGLLLLGGRPKEGKSWLAAQIALAFTTGHALGGWLKVLHPGRCQLWALEDGYSLTKDKVQKLLRGAKPDGLCDLRIVAELAKPLLAGGDEIIRATLAEQPTDLLILDSLFKLAGHQQPKADISQRDYDVIDCVRRIALDHHCAAIIVMHTRKGATGGDPIENLMGTTGNTAAADAVCELKRNGDDAKLTIVGRMVQRKDLELRWHDGDVWGWTIEGESRRGRGLGEVSEDILAFLQAEGAAKPGVISKAVKHQFNAVWMALQRLQAARRVQRNADRKWELIRGQES